MAYNSGNSNAFSSAHQNPMVSSPGLNYGSTTAYPSNTGTGLAATAQNTGGSLAATGGGLMRKLKSMLFRCAPFLDRKTRAARRHGTLTNTGAPVNPVGMNPNAGMVTPGVAPTY